jgi:thiamine-phosphate pyrophosphorylase
MRAAVTSKLQKLRGLYAITPDSSDTVRLVAQVEAALAGGACAIQYRNKSAPFALRAAQASELADVTRGRGALFMVNDDADLAHVVGADGVHIGEHDGEIAQARAMLGDDHIVGVSCYDDLERARRLVTRGADYVAFGSFFPSRVKPDARHAPLSLIAAAKRIGVPVVAIGGITADNAPALVAAGVDAVAVISDVFAHDDPASITRAAAAITACFPGS